MAIAAPLALIAGCATVEESAPDAPDAEAVHRDLLTLDTHLDTPINFGRPGWSFADSHDPATEIAQVDLGRMAEGALDGGFFVIFTAQGPLTEKGYADALDFARKRSDTIDREMALHSAMIGQATTAKEVRALNDAGKLIALKSMENSYPLGTDIGLLREFYDRGVRMAGPVHSKVNQFADSAEDAPVWNGLSPLGREWVAEMNRLGIVIDASHSSDATLDDMLSLSKAPIILSHSSPRWAHDLPRNIGDDRVRRIAKAGGAVCMSTIYLSDVSMGKRRAELFDRYDSISVMTPAEQAEFIAQWHALDAVDPLWATTFDEYMTALLHLIDVAGVDHVCFGADFDGGGGIAGLDDVSDLPKITARLLDAGFTPDQIGKMTGGNVLRILAAAEAAAE
ncbi:peptidase M19 [Croceicoccus naphthovorans]|uniref:Peptidase M19 n=1 Tax=Croceicoccus naphthovorans TaxID=1348774 RepID=A0A0G3XM89_9SPHN|nr:peptidase M19 [Croceicoccus naphthovorans]